MPPPAANPAAPPHCQAGPRAPPELWRATRQHNHPRCPLQPAPSCALPEQTAQNEKVPAGQRTASPHHRPARLAPAAALRKNAAPQVARPSPAVQPGPDTCPNPPAAQGRSPATVPAHCCCWKAAAGRAPSRPAPARQPKCPLAGGASVRLLLWQPKHAVCRRRWSYLNQARSFLSDSGKCRRLNVTALRAL